VKTQCAYVGEDIMTRQLKRAISFARQLEESVFRTFLTDLSERHGLNGDKRRAKALRAFAALDEVSRMRYLQFARKLPRRNEDCYHSARSA
jgi:hypothetical protein